MSDEKPKRVGPYPTEDHRSFGYHTTMTVVDAAASLIPGGSYAAGQIARRLVAEPLEKRREEWFTAIGEGLGDLQERIGDFDPSALADNEDFVSTVYEATHLAMKTHREEKREALRNAVLNVAAGVSIDEVLRGAFFSAVERYSPLHIRVLKVLSDPNNFRQFFEGPVTVTMNSKSGLLRRLIPMTEVPTASLDRVLEDLDADKMTNGSVHGSQSAHGLMSKTTTHIGDLFLKFISAPTD